MMRSSRGFGVRYAEQNSAAGAKGRSLLIE